MIELPTIQGLPEVPVTESQSARILAAFEGKVDADGEPIDPADAYRAWLMAALLDHVVAFELRAFDETSNEARRNVVADVTEVLSPTS